MVTVTIAGAAEADIDSTILIHVARNTLDGVEAVEAPLADLGPACSLVIRAPEAVITAAAAHPPRNVDCRVTTGGRRSTEAEVIYLVDVRYRRPGDATVR